MAQINKQNNEEITEVFTNFLNKHNHRKTPERFSILNEIYSIEGHFDIDSLYEKMNKKIEDKAKLRNIKTPFFEMRARSPQVLI